MKQDNFREVIYHRLAKDLNLDFCVTSKMGRLPTQMMIDNCVQVYEIEKKHPISKQSYFSPPFFSSLSL